MKKSRCIDAGRQGCPCALAECGQCLICAKLRGGTCQECSWQGTCIYSLYEQNGRSVILSRKDRLLKIKQIKTYSDDLKVFIVEADRGFCQKAQTAGAYVFVRAEDEAKWYDAPISVLKAEPEAGLCILVFAGAVRRAAASFRRKKICGFEAYIIMPFQVLARLGKMHRKLLSMQKALRLRRCATFWMAGSGIADGLGNCTSMLIWKR